MKNKKITGCLIGGGALLAAGIILLAGLLLVGVNEYKNLPRQVTGFDFGRYELDGYAYSGEQRAVVEEWGQPQSFYILFYQRENAEGRVETVRYEEWAFPARGKQVVFENGLELSRAEIPKAAVYSTRYSPEQFFAFMNREQLAALTGLEDWFILPVEKELMQDADLYYAGGLTFGLQHGEVIYVEAVHYEEQ